MTSFFGSRKRLFVWVWISMLVACGGDDGVVGTGFDNPPGGEIRISGAAEKGPFVKGSEVLVSRLAADGSPSTDTTLSEIQDDLGTFMFAVKQPGPVLIAADGYHFNEITGALSQGRLLLRAAYNANANAEQKAYVNVLTHLAYKRTMVLMSQGVSIDAALKQAELDVLQALSSVLPVTEVTDFTQLSIYDIDTSRATGNGYVLALSASVYLLAMKKEQEQKSSVDAELTALLNALSDDISDDGSIADNTLLTHLTTSTRQLRPDLIRANLEARSVSVGPEKLLVANMDLFIDTDGDGAVNAQDNDDDNDGMLDVEDSSPYVYSEAPVMLANAATGGVASKTPFTLVWTTSEYAKQIEVQLAKDDAFTDIMLTELAPNKQYTFTLDAGIYYVRARAQNELGGWGPWSLTTELPVDAFARAYVFSETATFYSRNAIQTSDGGFVVSGTLADPLTTGGDVAALVKVASTGAVQWQWQNKTSTPHLLSRVSELPTGELIFVSTDSVGSFRGDPARLVKLNTDGKEVWRSGTLVTEKFLDEKIASSSVPSAYSGTAYVSEPYFLLIEPDGIYMGMNKRFSEMLSDGSVRDQNLPVVVKLDLAGHAVWRFSLEVGDVLTGFWKADDGNYAMAAYSSTKDVRISSWVADSSFLAKLSPDGTNFSEISRTKTQTLPLGLDKALSDGSGGFIVGYDGGGVDLLQRVSVTGELRYSRNLYSMCNCEYMNLSYFIEAGTFTYGGTLSGLSGKSEPAPYNRIVIARMNVATGTRINSRVYELDLAQLGMEAQLFAFTPATDDELLILGNLRQTQSITGFVLIKTDPAGNAPKTLSQVITVTP